jgi:rod shape-determining protein MreC
VTVPRERTARLPVVGAPPRRRDGLPPRSVRAFRARLLALVLVLVSLGLITIYLRESSNGGLHEAQRVGLSILTPFEVAGERISRPFRDAWSYVSDLVDAKQQNAKLRRQNEALRAELVATENAVRENKELRRAAHYLDGPRFPEDYVGLPTRVIARPPSPFAQIVVVAAGSHDGVRPNSPVVTPDGLVGIATEVGRSASRVTLLTDQESAVSAVVLQSGAAGVVQHGPSRSSLVLDRVDKDAVVNVGDTVVTAGWKSGVLESLYPSNIPIGTVTAVGQNDVDLYKRIQVTPNVDFDSLNSVIVLVKKPGAR